MDTLQHGDVNNALPLLAETASERSSNITKYPARPEVPETDEDHNTDCSLLDTFYEEGHSV